MDLEEIGPAIDFSLRRTHLASDDHYKQACKQVKNVYKPKKIKNKEEDAFGTKLGKIHIPEQKVQQMQSRKMKGLKAAKKAKIQEKMEKAEKARQKNIQKVFNESD